MRKYALFVVVFLVTVSMAAKKKPKLPDPALCGIKTIYISGTTRAADEVREVWAKRTGIVVLDKEQALKTGYDAVMSVTQDLDLQTSLVPGTVQQQNLYVVRAAIVLNTGDQPVVWTFAHKDFIRTMTNFEPDPDSLVNSLVVDFNKKAACGSK